MLSRLLPIIRLLLWLILPVLLLWAAWGAQQRLNPDGVSYMRIAGYYLEGRPDLFINGYWGPMLSWLMVPFLAIGFTQPVAAHFAMAVSALFLVFASDRFLRQTDLPELERTAALTIIGLAVIGWSAEGVTPDLLMAGWVTLGMAGLLSREYQNRPASAFVTGLFWGFGYLAKSITLPLAILVIPVYGLFSVWRLGASFRVASHQAFLTLLAAALVAGPWIGLLTRHYGKFTLSTSAKAAHVAAAPQTEWDFHPTFIRYSRPEAGRVTSWEEPSLLPYATWSPLENEANRARQLQAFRENGSAFFDNAYLVFESTGLWLLSLGLATMLLFGSRSRTDRWRWGLLPMGALAALYIGLYGKDARYFYPIYPAFVAIFLGSGLWVARRLPEGRRPIGTGLRIGLPILLLLLPFWSVWREVSRISSKEPIDADIAWVIAQAVDGRTGPIAGGGHLGLYTAYLTGQPWWGHQRVTTAQEYQAMASQVRWFFTSRDNPLPASLPFLTNRSHLLGNLGAMMNLALYETSYRPDASIAVGENLSLTGGGTLPFFPKAPLAE